MTRADLACIFDDLLRDERLLDGAEAIASKRVQETKRTHLTNSEMAQCGKRGRAALDRLLDPTDHWVGFSMREWSASAVGKILEADPT